MNFKQLILFFLFYIIQISDVIACSSASQHRVIPLLEIQGELILFEVEMHRSDKVINGSLVVIWNGHVFIRNYNSNLKLKSEKLIDSIVDLNNVELNFKLDSIFALQSSLFNANYGNREVKIKEEFKSSNSGFVFEMDSSRNTVINISWQGKIYETPFCLDSLPLFPSLICNRIFGFDYDGDEKITLSESLFLKSVKVYQIGTKELLVFHVGIGDYEHLNSINPRKKNKLFGNKKVEYCENILGEQVESHGLSYDLFAWR